jgi:hypothetical protein
MSSWTDDPVTTSTHIRARHINELRRTVDARRSQAGYSTFTWSDGATVGVNSHIRAVHFTEIKAAIEQYTGPLGNWTAGSPPSTSRQVKASDMNDLRRWTDQFSADLQAFTGSVLIPSLLYGCDTNVLCYPCSADFYIGELGFATTPRLNNFNFDAAATVGCLKTYGYWFLYGPDTAQATTNDAAYYWGRQQGDAASQSWLATPQVCELTLFGDVEIDAAHGNYFGWSTTNSALNQKVWEGFYNQVASSTFIGGSGKEALYPAVYSLQSMWTFVMGSSYGLPPGTPVWSADTGAACSSCDNSSPSCPATFPALPTIGGVAPRIWQYNKTPGCNADLNVALAPLPP